MLNLRMVISSVAQLTFSVLYSSKSSVWKLTDFGLSCEGSSKTNRPTQYGRGTPGYRAPELIESDREPSFNNKVDIWAMGCILYEFATGIRLFKSDWEVLKYSISGKDMEIVLDDTFDAFSKEYITEHIIEMLRIAPSERPSAANLSQDFTNSVRQFQVTKLNHHDRDQVGGKSALSIVNEEISGNSPPPAKRQRTGDGNDNPQNVSTLLPPLRSTGILPPFPEAMPLFSTGEEMQINYAEFAQNTPECPNLAYLIETLLLASKFGNTTEVRSLLEKGVDVNAVGEDNGNALMSAINAENEAMALLLLEMGADVNSEYRGAYPLHKASMFGLEAVVRLLLEKGAEVDIRSNEDETPLQVAANFGHGTILRVLLENGADINVKGLHGTSALQTAVGKCDESAARLLLENGANVNGGDFFETPLQVATRRGYESMVRLLLENGAEVNTYSFDETPLQVATSKGDESVVRLLLENGADVNAEGPYGTPLQVAISNEDESVVQLLLENGADVNANRFDGTPLQAATSKWDESVVRLLLENGAEVNAFGPKGNAIQIAALGENKEMHHPAAVLKRRKAVVRLLLENGADVNAEGPYGTAVQIAVSRREEWMVQLLLQNGAIYMPLE